MCSLAIQRTPLPGPSSQRLAGTNVPEVMSGPFTDYFSTKAVFLHLDAQCDDSIKAHIGFPAGSQAAPRLFTLRCDAFCEDNLEQEWHGLAWSRRLERLLDYEQALDLRTDLDTALWFRIGQSAVYPAEEFFELAFGVLGCSGEWEIRVDSAGGTRTSWSLQYLRQSGFSLSSLLRAIDQKGVDAVRIDMFIPKDAIRQDMGGPMLPWMLGVQPAQQDPGNHDDAGIRREVGLSEFSAFDSALPKAAYAKTCVVDPLARVWEQAHLVPKALSPHTFKTVIAAVWRCLGHARSRTRLSRQAQLMFVQAQNLMGSIDMVATPEELSAALQGLTTLSSNRDNNMLPLQHQLRALLEAGQMYVCPFARMPVWAAKSQMPTSMVANIAGAYKSSPLIDHLSRTTPSVSPSSSSSSWPTYARAIRPAMWARASFVLHSLGGTTELNEVLNERARRVILRRKATPARAAKLGRHKRDDADSDEDDGGGERKQPRTEAHLLKLAAAGATGARGSANDQQQSSETSGGSGLQDEGQRTPGRVQEADILQAVSPSSGQTSRACGASLWSGGTAIPRAARSAFSDPTSVQTASEGLTGPTGRQTGKTMASAPDDKGKLASPVDERSATRAARSRTPSDDGDPLNSFWIKTGGSREEHDLRRAVVEVNAFSCTFKALRSIPRLPEDIFSYLSTTVKRLQQQKAGTWQPELWEMAEDVASDETNPEMQDAREKITPRIRHIFGLDERGKDTDQAILDAERFGELGRSLQAMSFFTAWPLALAGVTAAIDIDGSSPLKSEAQTA